MAVALCATAIVVVALLWEVTIPWFERRSEARFWACPDAPGV